MCATNTTCCSPRWWCAIWKVLLVGGLALVTGCPPVVDSFSPEEGPVGTVVTIKGSRFGEQAGDSTVKFHGVAVPAADVTYVSSTELKAKVPAGAQTGPISVTTSEGTGESDKDFKVEDETSAWTFMVYLDADNNLEYAGIVDFLEMASVPSSAKVNIIVQMDRIPGYSSDHGNWTDTRRFKIGYGNKPDMAPLQNLGEQNMGDPNVLSDFVEWAITNYPAQQYALSIWNHGDGWRRLEDELLARATRARAASQPDQGVARAVATDNTDDDLLYMKEVQTALEGARERLGTDVKLDVVGFDACLMGMVEVAYACRNVANYLVGSEDLEPGNGWPYDTILKDLVATPAMTPEQLATLIVDKYGAAYPNTDVTQACVDMAKVNDLAGRIDTFANAASGEWAALKAARLSSRQYHPTGFPSCWGVDIWNFAHEVHNRVVSTQIKTAATNLKTAVDEFVLHEYHSASLAGSHGVAIYFPPTGTEFNNDPDHTGYTQTNNFMPVDFVKSHGWDEWLASYYTHNP
ncbi:MAG: IPT/TIG domain-containing protein [Phycisphaerales bacterium]|nr:MAG: IPT/TIG domain-containing protein [Phycisphaerales bacterium]